MRLSKLFLYDEPDTPQIKIEDLANFLKKKTGIDVEVREDFLKHHGCRDDAYQRIESCRVLNPLVPYEKHGPGIEDIRHEVQQTFDHMALYDGFELQNSFRDHVPDFELGRDQFHLIFTRMLTGTFDHDDYRYHGRAVICSNPSIISTTGIVEAPAKPRDYYLRIYEKTLQGLSVESVTNEFRGRFLEYNDARLHLVVRGYALQAIFYYLTGTPFCISRDCLLHNAHWQEDLLYAQVERGKLCSQHQELLGRL